MPWVHKAIPQLTYEDAHVLFCWPGGENPRGHEIQIGHPVTGDATAREVLCQLRDALPRHHRLHQVLTVPQDSSVARLGLGKLALLLQTHWSVGPACTEERCGTGECGSRQ